MIVNGNDVGLGLILRKIGRLLLVFATLFERAIFGNVAFKIAIATDYFVAIISNRVTMIIGILMIVDFLGVTDHRNMAFIATALALDGRTTDNIVTFLATIRTNLWVLPSAALVGNVWHGRGSFSRPFLITPR